MEDLLQVGVITTTHGIKGEVKVFPTTDDPQRFRRLKEVILDTGKEQITLVIQGVKFFKQFAILKFEGIDSIEEVEPYRQKSLLVSRKDAVKLGRDEYFIADLIGLQVKADKGHAAAMGLTASESREGDPEDEVVGILKDVMETGANDVYVIGLKDGRELLLPAVKECVLAVDQEEGWIRIHILDGLLDL